ncbi:peptide chain release factor 2 [candidate division CPR3 bacterium GWF2_35_18]|uniref:Peptide chain release factor 2 n=1 Tax=candidate division CPR3 bacterium GW2011_GWF2_35_18 TaxID=1618350 RepID=A0A0G0ESS4_UNCC3|nr:MAG: Peptide chain release factor 2 [candidate division CPR3 bacterium GW2011_GWF2_35_18]KKP84885.1 MAG: Peptide chain release factor 2 [candidate division CPR3 bacterium GW2011_GWE2_35_7]OGB63560.1 MAG: peptide chain release factor 2 [candidate division CPR3 bacterium GWF2_35_18]OGB64669.1 MAG: peptide chain release factor 2 [candidate division CPR3 bacterium RIFOXYA2_FULL_35_13]OGB78780.1 MAG: peptide chain release factor 2 [candidate division CPR3 bacterium RIFOXYB2_FULL_35_8]OGB79696.1 
MDEIKIQLRNLKKRLDDLLLQLNLAGKQTRKRELEALAIKPDFWSNREKAEKVTQEISEIEVEAKKVNELQKRIEDGFAMMELLEEDTTHDKSHTIEDLNKEISEINKEIDNLEITLFLSDKYDRSDVVLTIYAGQGGTEACDWAEMISRMYTRYAEGKGWKVEEIDKVKGEEVGIKSVTFEIFGIFAYGYLKHEVGTHRLVRLSPYNANNLRQTSFAGVEVIPLIEEDSDIEIKEDDLEFEAYRSSGHGGQNIQKVSTAVRIKHKPTGIIVTCQVERSQAQNRERAMKMLRSKIIILEEEKLAEKKKELKGEHIQASWGNQIRSYVLHPYKMVKDLRTQYESPRPEVVLDGELDSFIEAAMKKFRS